MARKKSKSTPKKSATQVKYEKQVKRIKSEIRKLEKQGYYVTYQLPQKPQNFRGKGNLVKQLSEIKPQQLRELSAKIDLETGEKLSTAQQEYNTLKELQKQQRKINKQRNDTAKRTSDYKPFPQQYDVYIQKFQAMVRQAQDNDVTRQQGNLLQKCLDQLLSMYSRAEVGQYLQNNAENNFGITPAVFYNDTACKLYCIEFIRGMNTPNTFKQELYNELEIDESYEELL